MTLPTSKTEFAVVYFPFQCSNLLACHSSILKDAAQTHNRIVIALPVRRISPSKDSPLDFVTRQQMIQQQFQNAIIVPVVDTKYPQNKVKALETAVAAPFSEMRGKCDLYTDVNFANLYRAHGGKWQCADLAQDVFVQEAANRKRVQFNIGMAQDFKLADVQHAYRIGLIKGLNDQFPISWTTVDICIKRVINGKTFILLGKKPGENGWRFPGGFKDRGDMSFEIAVIREASEEILKPGVNPVNTLMFPEYIGSKNVDDWRYKGEIDGINTLFYQVTFIGEDDDIKAGDDLAEAEWFELTRIDPPILEGEHLNLYNMLLVHEGMTHEKSTGK
jgi:bifunctional NMN adenylyltransferase/nudix hydrolase